MEYLETEVSNGLMNCTAIVAIPEATVIPLIYERAIVVSPTIPDEVASAVLDFLKEDADKQLQENGDEEDK